MWQPKGLKPQTERRGPSFVTSLNTGARMVSGGTILGYSLLFIACNFASRDPSPEINDLIGVWGIGGTSKFCRSFTGDVAEERMIGLWCQGSNLPRLEGSSIRIRIQEYWAAFPTSGPSKSRCPHSRLYLTFLGVFLSNSLFICLLSRCACIDTSPLLVLEDKFSMYNFWWGG